MTPSSAWTLLVVSGLLEAAWALGMKKTHGFTRLWPSLYTVLTMGIGFYLLGLAVRELPVGTAYAVLVGIGAVTTAVAGMLLLGEPRTPLRLLSIGAILAGVAGLKLAGG
jgi:quaternary ammonium compound-resistance protein SugE